MDPPDGTRLTGLGRGRSPRRLAGAPERELRRDWEDLTEEGVGALGSEAGVTADDPRLRDLVGELSLRSERFRSQWARHEVRPRLWARHEVRPRRGRTSHLTPHRPATSTCTPPSSPWTAPTDSPSSSFSRTRQPQRRTPGHPRQPQPQRARARRRPGACGGPVAHRGTDRRTAGAERVVARRPGRTRAGPGPAATGAVAVAVAARIG
ncbi:hypothetical protein [Streptomyces camelliae]|uniref:MmyB-like transcription regulator ligand binding domain-containing protein n=1 Tax=Streptomyces camelliae TaxID=3004093 RepID=A0ABY7PIK5_9ACTN|nr:hypothetical protein [Streptomyces sp. HUAS 2-6]WBO68253.1 hypothetical protein O1G22_38290 [Streptomyces sp. HUAS 2-6]